jgi:hypothetical protein
VDGHDNTAIGAGALAGNTSGASNVAMGVQTLFQNTSGNSNIGIGFGAGVDVITANNVICIGDGVGGGNVSGTCFIGNIFGVTTGGPGSQVFVDSVGQLGTVSSSRRFKKDIESMGKTSEALLALKPVTFHYKSDKTNTSQFGLIAEEVAEVNPALIVRDKEGKPYSIRYDQVNAMLLNEFLKEHKKVEQLHATVAELKSTLAQQEKAFQSNAARQQKQIDALSSGLQQMDVLIHLQKPAAGAMAKY